MNDYTNTPKDETRIRVYFYGEVNPFEYPLILNGRVIKDVMIRDVHYMPERMCKNNNIEGYEFRLECSSCGYSSIVHNFSARLDELPNYCPNCGARVVSA